MADDGMREAYIPRTEEYLDSLNRTSERISNLDAGNPAELKEVEQRAVEELAKTQKEKFEEVFQLRQKQAMAIKEMELENSDDLDARLIASEQRKLQRQLTTEDAITKYIEKKRSDLQKKEAALENEYFNKLKKEQEKGEHAGLSEEQLRQEAQKIAKTKLAAEKKYLTDRDKLQQRFKKAAEKEEKKAASEVKQQDRKEFAEIVIKGDFEDKIQALKDAFTMPDTGKMTLKSFTSGFLAVATVISDLAKQMEKKVDDIAKQKSAIDTRLNGYAKSVDVWGSHFDGLVKKFTSDIGINGFIEQERLMTSLQDMVARGIAHNVDQRAFLNVIKDKIATTFDAADSTLLRLIRIQQQDTTAGRLGMEAALNAFLNNMYETTEYLSDVAASVRASLEEMESLMPATKAAEIEFQVQKWMGSMYSVGMSQSGVQSIVDALGKVAAGDVSALTNGGAGNLIVMAANEAGISIADILKDGLDTSHTNQLLEAMVGYLAEITNMASDSNVVQQQLANVYGLKASDLKAIANLVSDNRNVQTIVNTNSTTNNYNSSSTSNSYHYTDYNTNYVENSATVRALANSTLTYNAMLNELNSMANTMVSRTSMGEIMQNIWNNSQYSLAANLAASPISYLTYKLASMVDAATGGSPIPFISALGTGVDLETSVADLMRVGAMFVPALETLGGMISGLSSTFAPSLMLKRMGIGSGEPEIITRGTSTKFASQAVSGASTSYSGYVGNQNAEDIIDQTMTGAENDIKEQKVQALESEDADVQNRVIDEHIIDIYDLLASVISGEKSFQVKVGNTINANILGGNINCKCNNTGNSSAVGGELGSNQPGTNVLSSGGSSGNRGNSSASNLGSTSNDNGYGGSHIAEQGSSAGVSGNNSGSGYGGTSSSGGDSGFEDYPWSDSGNTRGTFVLT